MQAMTAGDVDELLRDVTSCARCVNYVAGYLPIADDVVVNAVAIDPAGAAHAGDVATGQTACGRDGSRWQWLVERARPEVEGPR